MSVRKLEGEPPRVQGDPSLCVLCPTCCPGWLTACLLPATAGRWDQQASEKVEKDLAEAEEDKRFMAINVAQAEQAYRVEAAQEDVRRFEQLRTVEVSHRRVSTRDLVPRWLVG